MQTSQEGFKSRSEHEEKRINKLEVRTIEMIKSEEQKVKD